MNPQPSRPQQQGFLSPDLIKSLDAIVDRLNSCSRDDSPSVYALLVSTNRGVPLARSYGTNTENDVSSQMNEESLNALETMWAANLSPLLSAGAAGGTDKPYHPLLRHLGMGSSVHTTTVFYDTCTLLHIYQHQVVITFLASPTANIGAIKSVSMPLLKALLAPVQSIIADIDQRLLAM